MIAACCGNVAWSSKSSRTKTIEKSTTRGSALPGDGETSGQRAATGSQREESEGAAGGGMPPAKSR